MPPPARLVEFLDLKGDATDYQKITAIYNYICTNVRYDYEHKDDNTYALKQTAYAAAIHKTAVCQGYATLFYRLALEAGVDCRYITGYAGEGHAWNLVKVDGQYYYLDSTWDEGKFQYGYFLKSAADFWDHAPDDRYLTEEFQTAHPIAQQSYQHPSLDGVTEDGFVYRVINGIAILTGYSGTAKDVVVPAKADGYPLCEVTTSAFNWNDTVESITFSEGIQILGSEAIVGCDNLKSVHLPSTVDFAGSKDPDFPCNNVWGPSQCPSVETITVAEGNPNVVVVDNVLYSKDMTILRYFPAADPREVFEIPEGVISISARAFAFNKNLKEVIMPDTVRMINSGAFQGCSNLEKINISNSCRQIGHDVFSGTAIESIHIPASVELLSLGSFGVGSKLKTITVDPENPYYYVEDGALYATYVEGIHTNSCDSFHFAGKWLVKYPVGADATSCTVPEGIVGIECYAFSDGTNLEEIVLPDGVTSIGDYAFYGCSGLTNITIPDSVTSIYYGAFSGCSSLTSVVIPDSVTNIWNEVFSGCSSLTSVVIPDSVTSIGSAAFSDCSSLTSIAIPDSVTSIGSSAFSNCRALMSVTIGTGVTSINTYAFLDCSSLTSVVIPDSVTRIGDSAFYLCTALTSVVIPDSVTSIGEAAFSMCDALTSIVIPDSVIDMGDYVFRYCSALTSVTIGNGVASIGSAAFYDCSALTSIVIPDRVTSIGNHAFFGCSSLTSVVIPDCMTSIGSSAFWGCEALRSVTIPDSVTTIGSYAFSSCTGLKEIHFMGTAPQIGEYCFSGAACDVYYPLGNSTWTEEVRQNYGGTITWVGYNVCADHGYSAVVTAPTCTEQGYTTRICQNCGDSYVDCYINALGHKFENEICTVCGSPERIPGDIDGNETVDVDDVLALLWNVLFPDDYPIEVEADFDHNGSTDVDDVLTLLWHVLFPEDYPL